MNTYPNPKPNEYPYPEKLTHYHEHFTINGKFEQYNHHQHKQLNVLNKKRNNQITYYLQKITFPNKIDHYILFHPCGGTVAAVTTNFEHMQAAIWDNYVHDCRITMPPDDYPTWE